MNMGSAEITALLTHLDVERNVAVSTQNQTPSALLFLCRYVLGKDLVGSIDAARPKTPKRLPTVLTKDEALEVIGFLLSKHCLMAKLLYGSGLRLTECTRLRVKDVDFSRRQIVVRDAKRHEGRVTMLPNSSLSPPEGHLRHVKMIHDDDLALGCSSVCLPYALERKCPNARKDWIWQYVCPASQRSRYPRRGAIHRHHIHESSLQEAIRKVSLQAHVTSLHRLPHIHLQFCHCAGRGTREVYLGDRNECAQATDGFQFAVEVFFLSQIGNYHVGKVWRINRGGCCRSAIRRQENHSGQHGGDNHNTNQAGPDPGQSSRLCVVVWRRCWRQPPSLYTIPQRCRDVVQIRSRSGAVLSEVAQ